MNRGWSATEAAEIVKESNFLQKGHWQLASGLHTNIKANFDEITKDRSLLERAAACMTLHLVSELQSKGLPSPDAVVGVPSGAELLATHMATLLEDIYKKNILVFRVTKYQQFRPVKFWVTEPVGQLEGADNIKKDKLNLVGIEDVTTTWGSVVRTVQAVSSANKIFYGIETETLALQSFAQRKSDSVANHNAPRLSLLNLNLEQVPADQCASCIDGVPLTNGAGESLSQSESARLF